MSPTSLLHGSRESSPALSQADPSAHASIASRRHPIAANAPGSAIDLTDMSHTPLKGAIGLPCIDDLDHAGRNGKRHSDMLESSEQKVHHWKCQSKREDTPESHSSPHAAPSKGLFREELYPHPVEPVHVEMGGVGDLAVLLRTIDFAAQVSQVIDHVAPYAHIRNTLVRGARIWTRRHSE